MKLPDLPSSTKCGPATQFPFVSIEYPHSPWCHQLAYHPICWHYQPCWFFLPHRRTPWGTPYLCNNVRLLPIDYEYSLVKAPHCNSPVRPQPDVIRFPSLTERLHERKKETKYTPNYVTQLLSNLSQSFLSTTKKLTEIWIWGISLADHVRNQQGPEKGESQSLYHQGTHSKGISWILHAVTGRFFPTPASAPPIWPQDVSKGSVYAIFQTTIGDVMPRVGRIKEIVGKQPRQGNNSGLLVTSGSNHDFCQKSRGVPPALCGLSTTKRRHTEEPLPTAFNSWQSPSAQ